MARTGSGRWKWLIASSLTIVIVAAGAIGWWQHTPLMAWYYVHRLNQVPAAERGPWIERLTILQAAALPPLLQSLASEDETTCGNAGAALGALAHTWGPNEALTIRLTELLAQDFGTFGSLGQRQTLELAGQFVDWSGSPAETELGVYAPLPRLLSEGAHAATPAIRLQALDLVGQLWKHSKAAPVRFACQEILESGLRDPEAAIRIASVELAALPEVNLTDRVALLLRDPVPEIRRAAMVAVGCQTDVLATDDLLYWLHDSDAEVRHLCETALRGRGLRDEYIRLGRLLTDSEARNRLRILDHLRHDANLDPGIWLRRLSHDPAAAVRAAAVRAAADQPVSGLADRIEQMVQDDPSPTVRQVAHYYLASHANKVE
jgi:hypothetical protein